MAMLLGLTALLYWPGLDGPFLLDDSANIGVLKSQEFSWAAVLYDITHNFSGVFGRPVSILSLAFTNIVHGGEPWGFKYHNLLLHLLAALLLFWFLLRFLPRLIPASDATGRLWIAGCAAALWLLHPLMVSTVLYAVQRMAQLSALFTLAALLAYTCLREAADRDSWPAFGLRLAWFTIALALAVLSKEGGALIPLYLLLMEAFGYRFAVDTRRGKSRLVLVLLAYVAVPVLLGSIYLLLRTDSLLNYSMRDFNLQERLMTQAQVVVFYVKTIVLPAISDMSLFHDGWRPVRSFDIATLLASCFWVLWCSLIIFLRNRQPLVAFGLAWFLVSHLMESTVFPLELVFEHRNYLAAAGLLLILVFLVHAWAGLRKSAALFSLILLLFAFMTHARVSEWRSEEMVYSMAARDHPDSVRAITAYATILYAKGELEPARELVARAIALEPHEYGSIMLQVLFHCNRNSHDEIASLLAEAVRRAGLHPTTPYSLSAVESLAQFMRKGSCPEVAPADVLVLLNAALAQPDNRANREFTGYLQRHIAIQHYFMGDLTEGFENFIRAYENTGWSTMLVELVTIQANLGSYESAEHLVTLLEQRNEELLGAESVMVEEARRALDEARQYHERRQSR